jgi:pimeloyl-ACP methyl ester carboxylesterase
MPLVAANGVRLHVQEIGDGPPVVLLHGLFIGSLASWYFTAAPTLARHHRVHLYDLRGHGRSERAPSGYDLGTLAADLAAVTADLGPGPIDLVGHSYGGLIALRYALDHQERVRRLVVVESPLPPSRFADLGELLGASPQSAARAAANPEEVPREMVNALPDSLRSALAGSPRQAQRLLRSLHFLAVTSTLLDDLRAEPGISDDQLAALKRRVLCVYGDRSACLGVGRRLARVLPDVELVILKGGHYLHLDAREPLVHLLQEFLAPDHLDVARRTRTAELPRRGEGEIGV